MLDQALEVIAETLPGWHSELPHALRQRTVGYQAQMHLSRPPGGIGLVLSHPSSILSDDG